jgi:hypothetical protein
MLAFIGWVVILVLFFWAAVSSFSIFSELKFLVDGWTWSVDHVPISTKAIALAIGAYVSDIVGGYREFVHGLLQMQQLPRLPQFSFDVLGVMTFSVGRGLRMLFGYIKKRLSEMNRLFGEAKAQRLGPYLLQRNREQVRADELEKILGEPVTEELARKIRRALRRSEPASRLIVRVSEPLRGLGLRSGPLIATCTLLVAVLMYIGTTALLIAALFGIDRVYRHFA